MSEKNYLQWLSSETITVWWHDSGDPKEVEAGKSNGAIGVTTNPVLSFRAIRDNMDLWEKEIAQISSISGKPEKAEALTRLVVTNTARVFEPQFTENNQQSGYVCGQIDPSLCSDRKKMIDMALRFSSWAPNISIKFPATAAGLDAFEECVAQGISCTSTVSFSVAQVVAAAERYKKGKLRAEKAGIRPKPSYAVIMIGRIDDYLREVILDRKAEISEDTIKQAGIAITKRAYRIFKERGYEAKLIIAALRGAHHMTSLCGGDLIMSIHPKIQKILLSEKLSRESEIDTEVSQKTIDELSIIPEFIKAYSPEGMTEEDFITFGVSQKTMTQFYHGGWVLLEDFNLDKK